MSNTTETYDADQSFPVLMARCVKYMRESLNTRLADNGFTISSEQWMVLLYLTKQDGITQQALAECCGITKVSVLNLIKKLEKSGLIVRHPDPIDGRSNRVYLTSEGRKMQRSIIPVANETTRQITKGIKAEDIEQLKRTLHNILGNLNR